MGIKPVDPNEPDRGKRMLGIIGESGSGKTFLLGTASLVPELCPFLIISCDASYETVTSPEYRKLLKLDFLPFKVLNIDTLADVNRILKGVEAKATTYNGVPFKTICIDNVSELHRRELDETLKDTNTAKSRVLAPDVAGRPDYLKVQSPLAEMLARARYYVPQNVIVTFAENASGAPEMGITRRMALPPGARSLATRFFSVLGLLESMSTGKRRLLLKQTSLLPELRDRTHLLPPAIEDVTMGKIYSYLRPVWNSIEPTVPEPTNQEPTPTPERELANV